MRVIIIRPNPPRRDDLIAELCEHGTVGILEDGSDLRAYFPESLDSSPVVTPENGEILDSLVEDDGPTCYSPGVDIEPVLLGQRFLVASDPAGNSSSGMRIPLSLPFSAAFGSGRHESTQLMVEAMEAYLQPGGVIIDAGCGSGILSEVARHLGASTVVACDIHTEAMHVTRQTCPAAAVFLGSVDAVQSSAADLVLANISAKVIDALADDLVRVAKPDTLLLLSGFIQDRTPERFRPEKILERNGWLCWICRPELVPGDSPAVGRPAQPFDACWW